MYNYPQMVNHLYYHEHILRQTDRSQIKGHRPAVLWFTGLSGSGKSTIANAVESHLNREFGIHTYLLDGDNIRTGLNHDLGFSLADRKENIRRVAEVAKLMYDAGLVVLTAFISPLKEDRMVARNLIGDGFVEVYVRCPIGICEGRDPKHLYEKARRGEIAEFTGISSPYEEPSTPELVLDSGEKTVEMCTDQVVKYLVDQRIMSVKHG